MAGLFTGCSPTSEPSPSVPVSAPPTVTLEPQVQQSTQPPTESPSHPIDAVTDPAGVAAEFMTAFARPDLDPEAWYTGVAGYLTPYSQTAYKGTDPARIQARAVTGPGTVLPGATDRGIQIDVPTDAGVFRVQLSRYMSSQPWQVDRAIPPVAE